MLETVDCAKNALDKRTGGTVNGGVTFGQNLTISWGGRTATYQENGDIHGPFWGGHLSSWIIARANTSNVSRDGWWRCGETGIIMQWGYVGNTNVNVNFPLTFPHACFNVMASNANAQGLVVDNAFAYPVSNTAFFVATKVSTHNAISNYPIYWTAVGH